MHRRADISKAKNELGYRPGNIVDAIRAAYDSFVSRGEIIEPLKPRAKGQIENLSCGNIDKART